MQAREAEALKKNPKMFDRPSGKSTPKKAPVEAPPKAFSNMPADKALDKFKTMGSERIRAVAVLPVKKITAIQDAAWKRGRRSDKVWADLGLAEDLRRGF